MSVSRYIVVQINTRLMLISFADFSQITFLSLLSQCSPTLVFSIMYCSKKNGRQEKEKKFSENGLKSFVGVLMAGIPGTAKGISHPINATPVAVHVTTSLPDSSQNAALSRSFHNKVAKPKLTNGVTRAGMRMPEVMSATFEATPPTITLTNPNTQAKSTGNHTRRSVTSSATCCRNSMGSFRKASILKNMMMYSVVGMATTRHSVKASDRDEWFLGAAERHGGHI